MTDNLLAQDNSSQPLLDPNKNYLEELVGEGKKFKSNADLARGKYEGDLYIKTLEQRLDESRDDLLKMQAEINANAKLDQLLAQLESKTQQQQNNSTNPAESENKQPTFDPKLIEDLISNKFSESEKRRKEQDNFNQVKNELVKRFGSNYQATVKEQITNLGLTDEFVNNLSRTQPVAMLRLLGLDQPVGKENFQAPPSSVQRNDNFAPKGQKRTWSYYQALRRKDPNLYRDPKIAVQMHDDAIALGDEFNDGDFHA